MKILKKTILFTLALGMNIDLPNQSPYEFTYELLYVLVPYEPVSIRGAVTSLRDESYLNVFVRNKQTHIALTTIGREALRSIFPGFRPTTGRRDHAWTVCLFLDLQRELPRSGKEPILPQAFRVMREFLLTRGFFALERGMYVLPKVASPELVSELGKTQMLNRVLMFETRRLLIGDELQIIRSLFPITSIASSRQSIIKTLDAIGKQVNAKIKLHPQTKLSFLTLIPKLMEYFSHDLVVPDIYFPQDILLSETKTSLFTISAQILPKLLLH